MRYLQEEVGLPLHHEIAEALVAEEYVVPVRGAGVLSAVVSHLLSPPAAAGGLLLLDFVTQGAFKVQRLVDHI